jgi:hypothetical protein
LEKCSAPAEIIFGFRRLPKLFRLLQQKCVGRKKLAMYLTILGERDQLGVVHSRNQQLFSLVILSLSFCFCSQKLKNSSWAINLFSRATGLFLKRKKPNG